MTISRHAFARTRAKKTQKTEEAPELPWELGKKQKKKGSLFFLLCQIIGHLSSVFIVISTSPLTSLTSVRSHHPLLLLLLPLCGGRRALTLAGLGRQVIRASPLMAWLVLGVGGSGTVFL